MKKILAVIICVILILAAGAGFLLFQHRGGDIVGVTTYPQNNKIIMNAVPGNTYVSGQGVITVGEGEHIHLEHSFKAGSFDVLFSPGKDEMISEMTEQTILDTNTDSLPVPEDWKSYEEKMAAGDSSDLFGQSGITGEGTVDIPAEPGDYTVIFYPHDANGKATVTTAK